MLNKYPLWKYLLLLFMLVVGLIYSLPNLYGEDPSVQMAGVGSQRVGHTQLMQAEDVLQRQGITPSSASQEASNLLLLRFTNTSDQLKAQRILRANFDDDHYTVALSLAPATPTWLQALGAYPMKLGLDLRGGVHMLLAVDVNDVVKRRVQGDARMLVQRLREQRIRYRGMSVNKAGVLHLRFASQQAVDKAQPIIQKYFPTYSVQQQAVHGGIRLSLQMTPAATINARNYAVNQTMTVLRKRIDELGVSEPVVQRQGASRISVDLPGVQDSARAKQILGGTATLEFHLVDTTNDASAAAASGNSPVGSALYHYEGRPILLNRQVILSGTAITNASASFDQAGKPSVNIRLGGGGEALFNRTTAANVGKPMAIIYVETKTVSHMRHGKLVLTAKKRKKVINVATIQSALGNNFQITGLGDPRESRNLALLLRAGALPAPMSIIEESTVGPSLGKANIEHGVQAVVLGFLAIVVIVALYYGIFGLLADVALFLNLVLLVAALSLLGATLTLPGIAGIVLTVGMAVDANVLIFERIREELRNGVSPQAAIHAGYEKAFITIVDANVTTLLVALILFALGSGAVKGFAVTLILGLLISMVTAIMGTRAMVNLFYGSRIIKWVPVGIKPLK